jgi:hypothetical protein
MHAMGDTRLSLNALNTMFNVVNERPKTYYWIRSRISFTKLFTAGKMF